MVNINIKISNQLLNYREKASLTRQQVAEKIGCTVSAICQWENGKRQPDADTLIKLIHIYNVHSISEFFGEKEDSQSLSNSEKMLLSLYREANYECKNIVNLILKNYGKK